MNPVKLICGEGVRHADNSLPRQTVSLLCLNNWSAQTLYSKRHLQRPSHPMAGKVGYVKITAAALPGSLPLGRRLRDGVVAAGGEVLDIPFAPIPNQATMVVIKPGRYYGSPAADAKFITNILRVLPKSTTLKVVLAPVEGHEAEVVTATSDDRGGPPRLVTRTLSDAELRAELPELYKWWLRDAVARFLGVSFPESGELTKYYLADIPVEDRDPDVVWQVLIDNWKIVHPATLAEVVSATPFTPEQMLELQERLHPHARHLDRAIAKSRSLRLANPDLAGKDDRWERRKGTIARAVLSDPVAEARAATRVGRGPRRELGEDDHLRALFLRLSEPPAALKPERLRLLNTTHGAITLFMGGARRR